MANTQKYLNHLLQSTGITPACSEEERVAADVVADIFRNHGFEPEIQEFSASQNVKIVQAAMGVLVFVGAVLAGIGGVAGVVGLILAIGAAVIFMRERAGHPVLSQLGGGGVSQNVIAFHKASGPLASPRNRPVVVVAHYDSPRADFFAQEPLAAYRPLLIKLLPAAMIAAAVLSVIRLLPFPGALKVVVWALSVICALVPLVNAVAIIANRFFLPYTSGAVCNKSSVAAMLGVMDAVAPLKAGAEEFPQDVPFEQYMDEQHQLLASYYQDVEGEDADPYGHGDQGETAIPRGAVEPEFAPSPESAVEWSVAEDVAEQPAVPVEETFEPEAAPSLEEDLVGEDAVSAEPEPMPEPAAAPAPAPAAEEEFATTLLSGDEIAAALAEEEPIVLAPDLEAREAQPAPVEEPVATEPSAEAERPSMGSLPVNAAGAIRFGAEAIRALGMVDASCEIVYEAGALPVPAVAPVAEPHRPVEVAEQPAPVAARAVEPVAPVAPVAPIAPAAEPAPAAPEVKPVCAEPVVSREPASVVEPERAAEPLPVEEPLPLEDMFAYHEPVREEEVDAEPESVVPDASAADTVMFSVPTEVADASFENATEAEWVEMPGAEVESEPVPEPPALEWTAEIFEGELPEDAVFLDFELLEEGVIPEEPEPEPEPEPAPVEEPVSDEDEYDPADAWDGIVSEREAAAVEAQPAEDEYAESAPEPVEAYEDIAENDEAASEHVEAEELPEAEDELANEPAVDEAVEDKPIEEAPAPEDQAQPIVPIEEEPEPTSAEPIPAQPQQTSTLPAADALGRTMSATATLSADALASTTQSIPHQTEVERTISATQGFKIPSLGTTSTGMLGQDPATTAAHPTTRPSQFGVETVSNPVIRQIPPVVPDASALQRTAAHRRVPLFDLPDPSVKPADPFKPSQTAASPSSTFSRNGFTVYNTGASLPASQTAQSPATQPAPQPKPQQAPAREEDEGDFPAPAPVQKRAPRFSFRSLFKGKKRDQDSMSDWLGVDEDFDAKRDGGKIGSWENFEDDDAWKGGATGEAGVTEEQLREAITSMGDDELLGHNIWFVATGASEYDNAGMRVFIDEHRSDLRGVFVINLESVGAGRLSMVASEGSERPLKGDRRITRLVTNIASAFHHQIGPIDMPYIDTDAHVAQERNLRALTLAGIDGNHLACSHSLEDQPINVDVENVQKVSEIVTEVIRRS